MVDKTIKCEHCGKEFIKIWPSQRYCTPKCRDRHYYSLEREYRQRQIEKKRKYTEHSNSTLCWKCKNATGGCSWSQDFTPVEGWDAKRTRIRLEKGTKHTESFIVKKCPEFLPDER